MASNTPTIIRSRNPGKIDSKLKRAASSFDPKSISGLFCWYKTDTGIISDGYNVSSWQDQSGNNNHLAQSNLSFQPIIITNNSSGIPSVKFGASFLNFTTGINTQTLNVFVVLKAEASGGSQTIIGSSGGGFQYLVSSPGQYCNKTFVVGMGGDSTPIPSTMFSQVNVRYDSTNLSFRYNKQALSVMSYPTTFGNPSITAIGRSQANGSEYFKGELVELLIYSALPIEQIQQVEDYLEYKL